MTHPAVELVLDAPGAPLRCGSAVSGRVNVAVMAPCERQRLIVAMGYRSSGSAPTQTIRSFQDIETQELFSGAWAPGEYSYPFKVTVPDACNYAGTHMTVEWYLRAGAGERAETSFDVDSAAELALAPGPAEPSPADRKRRAESEVVRKETARTSPGCLLTSLALIVGGSFLAWIGLDHDAALPGVVAAVVGLAGLGLLVRQALVNRKLSMTEVRFGSSVTWPGEVVPVSVTVQARTPIEVERAVVSIEGWEQVRKFTGIHRSTGPVNKHVVHAETHALDLPCRTLPAQVPIQLAGSIVVPADASCTMDFDSGLKLLWRVEVRIAIKGSPDWFDFQPLTVLPRIAGN